MAKLWRINNKTRSNFLAGIRRDKWLKTPKGIFFVIKNNSRVKKREFLLTKPEFIEWYTKKEKICYYCGLKERKIRLQIERKDNTKFYSLDNMELACKECNSVKGSILSEKEMLIIGDLIMKKRWQIPE